MSNTVTRLLKSVGIPITIDNYIALDTFGNGYDIENVEAFHEAAEAVVRDQLGDSDDEGIEHVIELVVTKAMKDAARRRNQARRR